MSDVQTAEFVTLREVHNGDVLLVPYGNMLRNMTVCRKYKLDISAKFQLDTPEGEVICTGFPDMRVWRRCE